MIELLVSITVTITGLCVLFCPDGLMFAKLFHPGAGNLTKSKYCPGICPERSSRKEMIDA